MKKNLLRRITAITSSALLCAGACVLFAGCTTNNPEVRITYTFNGKDYEVDYKLSRLDAPKTVTHFLELADAGFYDGTCVHDYDGTYYYMGGYKLDETDGATDIEPIDYFSVVKSLETEKFQFTQSVWKNDADRTPLYTVYGEFDANGNYPQNGREFAHEKGALVMYYTDKGNFNERVTTERNDGGKGNGGNKYDSNKYYKYNSATSLFYTYTGERLSTKEQNYSVFGKAKNYADQFQPLVDAINEFIEERTDAESGEETYSFTTEKHVANVNEYEHAGDPDFEDLYKSDVEATYKVPLDKPIVIKSVKVTKY